MPAPFLSYLRVYEPLRAFDGPGGVAVRAALARGAVPAARAGAREREAGLRAQLAGRLLPGDPPGPARPDVLVLAVDGGDPLVCPLDTRARAAAAVLAFVAAEPPPLRAAALPVPERAARTRAAAALAELGDGAAHVVSATWTVPLPWFALVDPAQRRMRLDGQRRVWWRVPITRARARTVRALAVVRERLGPEGPAEVLGETARWLERFDHESVVELDYGGIADLLPDAALRADPSAVEVHEALRALGAGDTAAARASYERLRAFWAVVTAKQRCG